MKEYDVIIVDGSSYLFRAYHALPGLTNRKGEPTGAIYGVINMLMKLQRTYESQYFIVVFDAPGKNFRHEIFVDYKANRVSMPDDLKVQIKPLHTIIQHLGLPILIEAGVEADDVIASLAKKAESSGMRVLISTGDKDLAQLVTDQVHLLNTMTDYKMDPQGVIDKFGIRANQVLDYLTLIGDSSDNIPGIQKVGPKTAVKWLTQYDTLEGILAHSDSIKGVVGRNLVDQKDQIPWVQDLIRLKDDMSLDHDWSEFVARSPDQNDLVDLFKQLDFNKWAREIESEKRPVELRSVTQWAQVEQVFTCDNAILLQVEQQWVILSDQIILASGHEDIFQDHTYTFLDSKSIFKQVGVQNTFEDLTLMQYCVHSSVKTESLESWLQQVMGQSLSDDAKAVLQLGQMTQQGLSELAGTLFGLKKQLAEALKQQSVIYQKEKQLLDVILNMEKAGVLLDTVALQGLDQQWEKAQSQIQTRVFEQSGQPFNLDSPKQLRRILFEKLQLPVLEKTAAGAASTSESVLSQLAKDHAIANDILSWRMYAKLRSTYTHSLINAVSAKSGRVHAEFLQNGTNTGRLSSRQPNLQNIPIKTQEGRKIRTCFVASPGKKLLAVDYSQIELRLIAHLANDQEMIDALKSGQDIHTQVASSVFSIAIDQVTQAQRRKAKAVNFGLIYGISPYGLSKNLDIDMSEAKDIIGKYFERFSNIQCFMKSCIDQAHAQGHVVTPSGRKIDINGIHEKHAIRRQAAERVAINAPVQGMAADIMKQAMLDINQKLLTQHPEIALISQVHDELVFEVLKENVEAYAQEIVHIMQNVTQLKVPLIAVAGIGDNWDEAH
ncbi:DNA polymerase I [Gammaproteobacteria bacterium]|nr:DNA polymerase I [Gammaproteobacteria bacterium]